MKTVPRPLEAVTAELTGIFTRYIINCKHSLFPIILQDTNGEQIYSTITRASPESMVMEFQLHNMTILVCNIYVFLTIEFFSNRVEE